MKKYPYCAEDIKDEAKKCRYCGEWLAPKEDLTDKLPLKKSYLKIKGGCPKCFGKTYSAYIAKYGRTVDWCPHCKMSLEEMYVKSQLVCPHCRGRDCVTTKQKKVKKGVSGTKVMAGIATLGVSLVGTGLARKEMATEAKCSNCGAFWYF